MKIGFIIAHPTQFEGPFFQYAAKDKEHQIRVIYTNPEHMEKIFDPELSANVSWGIDLLSGYSYATMPRSKRMRWLLDEINREKYDLLIINGYSRSEYILASLFARLRGTPVALRLDSVQFGAASISKHLLKKINCLAFKKLYTHFFATGSLTVKYLQRYGIKKERISLFSYAVDSDYFKEKSCLNGEAKSELKRSYQLPDDSKVILSITKFNEREAPWDLLKAFCAMGDEKIFLMLVGDGKERAALEQYAQAHPASHVIFAGYVPYTKLPALYGIADLFVHPVQHEAWGVSVHEALACGLPVIASSRVGAGYDLIAPDKNGAIYEAGDDADLREKLARFLNSPRREDVCRESELILSSWTYASSWRSILEVGQRYLSS
ncbi:MAG TPA: glycosyltransferase [Pyrinomonadaceae bacterium]|nr:glycosyltransferase [Pyrinomonadaceae bacterium]